MSPKLIGRFMKEGWKGESDFYLFKCQKHGQVVSYKQGLAKELRCPECQKERNQDG